MNEMFNVRRVWSHEDSRSFSEIFCNPGYLQFGILSRHTSPTYVQKRFGWPEQGRSGLLHWFSGRSGRSGAATLSHVDRHNASAEIHLASTPPV